MEQLSTTEGSLPLISFGPGVFDASRIDATVQHNKDLIDRSGVPLHVVKSILRQNGRRRHREADSTFRDFMGSQEDWTSEQYKNYAELRKQEMGTPTPDERIDLFLNNSDVRGYEFYARLRPGERNLLDASFATDSLRYICETRPRMELVNTETHLSLPKVTRKIGNFAVVTTKITVGTMRDVQTDERYVVKSRQAGVIDLDQVDDDVVHRVEYLADAKPCEDKYVRDRLEVREFLRESSDSPAVSPVVESNYLVRI